MKTVLQLLGKAKVNQHATVCKQPHVTVSQGSADRNIAKDVLNFEISDPDSDVPANTIYLYATGDDILRPFSYTSEHYWRNVGCLIALAVGFRFIGYLVLAFKFRKANR